MPLRRHNGGHNCICMRVDLLYNLYAETGRPFSLLRRCDSGDVSRLSCRLSVVQYPSAFLVCVSEMELKSRPTHTGWCCCWGKNGGARMPSTGVPGACMLGGTGAMGVIGRPWNPSLVVLVKLELGPGSASVVFVLLLYQSSRSRPWRILISIASALDACAMIWKN